MTATQSKIAPIAALMVLAGCTTPDEGAMGFVIATYDAELTGSGVAGTGDADGHATAQLVIQRNTDAVCYNVWNVRGIDEPTAAHIHRGAKGQNGPVIVTLKQNGQMGWNGCKRDPELIRELTQAAPVEFYVQIRSSRYPAGAIRGQLKRD